ncbi:hypothetical protein [Novosphingobium sp. Gsoil 351]|uniref:hypothetical protein n=1 Tax=Novosphingobium sp. Gsoil 351 TaxID=2675225 RepID=UPI0012B50394|nr:hypothetical protein [Novosphingobium sp. Gsoil 351]QGN54737.1 hypothetical protein GKE62_09395 [Novosphingobium sp. Gsoil 351]
MLKPVLAKCLAAAAVLAVFPAPQGFAQERTAPPVAPAAPTYADLADLADHAPLVARVEIREAIRLKPEQAPGLRGGMARVFVKARTRALLLGETIGESASYLADVPLDAKGKLPKLKKAVALIFARPVAARPGELQLVATAAQVAWSQPVEERVRSILTELVAPGAPPRVTGVREISHVPGNLVGEGETQMFLTTEAGDPVSISVLHRPGEPPRWGVAFGEIVDQAARPPVRDTLAWYRLACFLPAGLSSEAVLSGDGVAQRIAAQDYRYVRGQLGACPRTLSGLGAGAVRG